MTTNARCPMRFSIRDLLWATLVVAMGLGWWVKYQVVETNRAIEINELRKQITEANVKLMKAEWERFWAGSGHKHAREVQSIKESDSRHVDGGGVLNEPLAEP